MAPDPELVTLELARMCRFETTWERRFHEYQMLLTAGIDADEAERIVRRVAADRAAETIEEIAA